MHHKKLKKWNHFGWHADGDSDIEWVALRELEEEGWIYLKKEDLIDWVVDFDKHIVPENSTKWEAEHYHYDIRFFTLIDKDVAFIKQDKDVAFIKQDEEVDDIRWFTLSEAREQTGVPIEMILNKLNTNI